MKKEKVNMKLQREQNKAKTAAIYSNLDKQKAEKRKSVSQLSAATAASGTPKKKSKAKAAGLKSIFTINGEGQLLMTSFGRGNIALPEKEVQGEIIKDLQTDPAFSAIKEESCFIIKGRTPGTASADNPCDSVKKAGSDLIGLRSELEQQYFGRTFEDNVHIQLIHNALDIEKILTVHINNIIYEIYNLFRYEDDSTDDLIGSLDVNTGYDRFLAGDSNHLKQFEAFMRLNRRAYFGETLFTPLKDTRKEESTKEKKARRNIEQRGRDARRWPTIKAKRKTARYLTLSRVIFLCLPN